MALPVLHAQNPIVNTSSLSQDKPLTEIESSLDILLTPLLKERERERKASLSKPTKFRVISCTDLIQMPIVSDQEAWQERIIEHQSLSLWNWLSTKSAKYCSSEVAPI